MKLYTFIVSKEPSAQKAALDHKGHLLVKYMWTLERWTAAEAEIYIDEARHDCRIEEYLHIFEGELGSLLLSEEGKSAHLCSGCAGVAIGTVKAVAGEKSFEIPLCGACAQSMGALGNAEEQN